MRSLELELIGIELKRLNREIENDLIERLNSENHRLRLENRSLHERIESLEESLHYAVGCSDLAQKHRDEAEKKLERITKIVLEEQVNIKYDK